MNKFRIHPVRPQREQGLKQKAEKRRKTNTNASKKSVQDENDDEYIEVYLDDGICEVCMLNTRLEWVGCDLCTRWYHYECLPHSVQTEVDFSIVTGSDWKCARCDEE